MKRVRFLTSSFSAMALVAVTLLPTLSLSAAASADEIDLKQRAGNGSFRPAQPLSADEKRVLDEQYQRNLAAEDAIDKNVGTILVKYAKNKSLFSKAVSVEKSSKIEAMQAIVKVLEGSNKVTESERSNLLHFLNKYAPYAGDEALIQKSKTISGPQNQDQEQVMTLAATAYDRTAASNYALQYAYTYNVIYYPNLTSMGGDCTNFVSQAMKAGGKPFESTWYITKKNNTYTTPTTAYQLNYTWGLASPSPWISAAQFETFWTNRLSNEVFTASYVANNQSTIFNKPYYRGDVIQILEPRYWWYEAFHTMMVTGYGSTDYLMSYHTGGTKNKPLHDIAVTYQSSGYKFKFFSVR